MPRMKMIKSGLKEQRRQNYSIDFQTAWEGCIYVLIAAMVLSEFVQPSILRGSGYVRSHLGNIELNLKQDFFSPKLCLSNPGDKTLKGIKDLFFFCFTKHQIWI